MYQYLWALFYVLADCLMLIVHLGLADGLCGGRVAAVDCSWATDLYEK